MIPCIQTLAHLNQIFRWKPHGFDVQDIRLGALLKRLSSCRKRLVAYVNGETESIPELEEELLCRYGNGKDFIKVMPNYNDWGAIASVNLI